jgi:hypothetical protein
MLGAALADELGCRRAPGHWTISVDTRFGRLAGWLERMPLRFPAIDGETLEVQATCFISEDWPGPNVIGWKGCLERIRFGIDPTDDSFYFAEV